LTWSTSIWRKTWQWAAIPATMTAMTTTAADTKSSKKQGGTQMYSSGSALFLFWL